LGYAVFLGDYSRQLKVLVEADEKEGLEEF